MLWIFSVEFISLSLTSFGFLHSKTPESNVAGSDKNFVIILMMIFPQPCYGDFYWLVRSKLSVHFALCCTCQSGVIYRLNRYQTAVHAECMVYAVLSRSLLVPTRRVCLCTSWTHRPLCDNVPHSVDALIAELSHVSGDTGSHRIQGVDNSSTGWWEVQSTWTHFSHQT